MLNYYDTYILHLSDSWMSQTKLKSRRSCAPNSRTCACEVNANDTVAQSQSSTHIHIYIFFNFCFFFDVVRLGRRRKKRLERGVRARGFTRSEIDGVPVHYVRVVACTSREIGCERRLRDRETRVSEDERVG